MHAKIKINSLAVFTTVFVFLMGPPALNSQEVGIGPQVGIPIPNSCTVAGTWYGGGPAAKYLLTVIPDGSGDFTMMGNSAFSQAALGFPVQTAYSGAIKKGRRNFYESFGIQMVNANNAFPAPTPEILAVHATVRLVDCDTLIFSYDFFGGYYWSTMKTPFLDVPDYVVVPPPFTETYHKMPTTCKQCAKQ